MKLALGRLKRREEFLRVAGAKRKWVAPGLILQAARVERPGRGGPGSGDAPEANAAGLKSGAPGIRVGLTVSRKVGKSVVRNRARRRLRAVVAEVMPVHAEAAFDFVVIGRSRTLTRPYPALVRDLETALEKLGAFRPAAQNLRATGRDEAQREGRAAKAAVKEKGKTA